MPVMGAPIPVMGGPVMPGVGPAPKPADRRARRNKDSVALTVLTASPVAQPSLPDFEVEVDGSLVEFVWPARTIQWWEMWRDSPLASSFTDNDWSELIDTARLHAAYWRGDLKLAAELRLRVAKFGATPEDRARLRISFATADDVESKVKKKAPSRSRTLKALPDSG